MDDSVRSAAGGLGEYAYQSGGRERPMTEVVRDIIGNMQEMVRSEVRLARVEIREETARATRAGAMLAAGGVLAIIAGVFILVCIAQLLNLVMPAWAATLIIALVLGASAAVMISKGRSNLHVPTPDKTIENVKENIEWMKNQTKS
jgi:uncharacterized membrane protein YqjE